jgi:hypothetical protein
MRAIALFCGVSISSLDIVIHPSVDVIRRTRQTLALASRKSLACCRNKMRNSPFTRTRVMHRFFSI